MYPVNGTPLINWIAAKRWRRITLYIITFLLFVFVLLVQTGVIK